MSTNGEITWTKINEGSDERLAYPLGLQFNPRRSKINRNNNNNIITLEIALPNNLYRKKIIQNISTKEHNIILYHITDGNSETAKIKNPEYLYTDKFPLEEVKPNLENSTKSISIIVFVDNKVLNDEMIKKIQKKAIDQIIKKTPFFCLEGMKKTNGDDNLIPEEACGGILG